MKILLVEDEAHISDVVIKYLEKSGYESQLAKNGFDALEKISEQVYHLVLLDVMMPGIDGFEVLFRIRETSDVPVIMLTAKQEEVDRLKGFEMGADDYVIKPFSPRELMSRIKVILKRVYNAEGERVITCASLTLYPISMKVEKNGSIVDLTATEFKLLHTFMKNIGRILSREQLIEQSFGFEYEGFDRNIDSYIKRLRQKIEVDSKSPKYLVTKYGLGYVFGGGAHDNT